MSPKSIRNPWTLLLLLIPFIALLWPPFYNQIKPEFFGIPKFLWYQFLWIIVTAVLTIAVYFVIRPARELES